MKKPRLALLLAAAGLVALLAVLWLKGRGGEGAELEAGAPEPDRASASSPVRARGDRGPDQAPQQAVVLTDDDPRGALRLEGLVLDADEQPVAGASVTLSSNPPRVTKSGEDGAFFFDELVGRTYTLIARAGGGAAGPVSARLTETSEPVILRIRAAAAVEVTVVDAARGEPVAGAEVELRGLDRQRRIAGDAGVARFDGVVRGTHAVAASARGFARSHGYVQVGEPGTTATLRLALRPGAPVAGRVVGAGGEPIAGARVTYAGASEWSIQADPRLDSVETDARGRFRFEALPAGSFRFNARADRFAPGRSEIVTLDGTTARTDLEIRLEAGAILRGLVRSVEGDPAAGARVRIAETGRQFDGTREAYADEKGRFEVSGLPRRSVAAVALAEVGSSEIVEVDLSEAPSEREIELVLDVTGSVAGVVVDAAGEEVEGAQVFAMPDFERRLGGRGRGREMMRSMRLRGVASDLSDAGGRFEVRGLEPGTYSLRALPPGVAGGMGQLFRREGITAETGQRDLRIVLQRDGRVKGKVAFQNGEAPEVFSARIGWGGGTPFATADGSFELVDVPPGTHALVVTGPGFDRKEVPGIEVEEGEVADVGTITVVRGRRLSGRVVDGGGAPVAGALVRAGKFVFGDGSSSRAAFGGPPQSGATKETESDERGEFVIHGLVAGDFSVVAEHAERGRSRAVTVRQVRDSVTGLDLALVPFGALEGRVTRGGAPQEQMIVNAASLSSPTVSFGVITGADGTFRFDRLAGDEYKVSVMTGMMPMAGMGFHSRAVTVEPGKTARVELSIDAGEVTLVVRLEEKSGGELGSASIALAAGTLSGATSREVQAQLGAKGDDYSHWGISIRGQPHSIENLLAGDYSVCVVPFPAELTGMGDTMSYLEREGDELPAFCRPVTVSAQPSEQSITLQVTTPPFVPPPPS